MTRELDTDIPKPPWEPDDDDEDDFGSGVFLTRPVSMKILYNVSAIDTDVIEGLYYGTVTFDHHTFFVLKNKGKMINIALDNIIKYEHKPFSVLYGKKKPDKMYQ